jgi:hypothetical protein
MDANGQIHTCAFTSRGMFQLGPFNSTAGVNPWTLVGGPTLHPGIPIAARAFANLLYWTNGNSQLTSWDGIAGSTLLASGLSNAIFGGAGSSIGGVFLFEINDQICMLDVSLFNVAQISNPIPGTGTVTIPAGSVTNYPQLLWYSANGIPNQFDPTANTSAGFNNFLDVPDQFTGVIAIGEIAYLFRTNGITQMTINGSALAPFYFDHLWSSEQGIGSVYPWSIAQFGSVGMFISVDNIYRMSVNSFQQCGHGARDSIMGDLALATLNPTASIIPTYAQGFVYLTYQLAIPQGNQTKMYYYSIEDDNWGMEVIPNILVTGRASVCWR